MESESNIIIEANNLTKVYGNNKAVSDISFKIEKGRIYGFLGPNGAGKSTTMNMMTGCLSSTKGNVTVGGYDILEEPEKAKKLIGYLPELPPLYMDRTPYEYLKFVAEAKRVPRSEMASQLEYVMEVTNIKDVSDRLIKNLSKGYKQRVGVAQALLGDPEVVILDEPTVGLDPRQIIEIRDLIKELGKKHTVILSSHILSEVQAVCDMIIIISKGKLIACDTPERLECMFEGVPSIQLVTEADEKEARAIIDKAGIKGKLSFSTEDTHTKIVIDMEKNDNETEKTDKIEMDEILKKLFFAFADAKKVIFEMSSSKASLEDIFIELTSSDSDDNSDTADEEIIDDDREDDEEGDKKE